MTYNGADEDPGFEVRAEGHEVVVTTSKRFDTWFGAVIGRGEITVTARAVARWDLARSGGFAPIAVFEDAMPALGGTTTIWDSDKEPPAGEGIAGANRGWLGLDCEWPSKCAPSNAELKQWMRDGYPVWIEADRDYMGDPGTKAATMHEAWIGQIIIVPVYDKMYHFTNDRKCDLENPNNCICCSEVEIEGEYVDCDVIEGPEPCSCKEDKCCCTEEARDGGHCNSFVLEVYTPDTNLNGQYYYHIIDFATFEINEFMHSPDKGIRGEFTKAVIAGEPGTAVETEMEEYHPRVVRLIE